MEEKLLAAAEQLPEPKGDFLDVEERAKKAATVRKPNRKKRIVILMTILCLLVTACAYSSTKCGLWGGYHSSSYKDAQQAGETFGYVFPETMNGSPFQSYSTAYGAPEGYTRLQALLWPTYKLYSIRYAVEKKEIREDGTYYREENSVDISFGTTEKEPWKYHFSVAEDGSKNYHRVDPDSKGIAEYDDYTLHLYTIGDTHSVMWEDKERKMIIDLTCYDLESQEDAVEIAKELIDLNREDNQESTQ